jgi:hypothetical protein
MPSPFTSLTELLEDLLSQHIDKDKLNEILVEVKAFKSQQDDLVTGQTTLTEHVTDLVQDMLEIKAFLGVPDARIGATQEDLDKLAARFKQTTQELVANDLSIPKPLDAPNAVTP